MASHGTSGRIVIDIEPDLKRRLYSTLSLNGSTLKEWFLKSAEQLCEEQIGMGVRREVRYELPKKASRAVVREEMPAATASSRQTSEGKFKLVSMFSGCGGMDLGFVGGFELFGRRYKSLPFEATWANDLNREACKTYERNLGHKSRPGDAWTLMDEMPKEADVLVGGFPCQDISVNGKRTGVNGERSGLYKAMVEAVGRIRPKVFVAENVKALLKQPEWLEQVLKDFRALGYTLHYQLYRAADYGVPQSRERLMIVGTAPGVREFTPPKPERNASSWMTAKEAIGDLENVEQ
ncbi:MAG: DNA (cytosine-5-)-methyltransferase, partial [Prosthecobacter sp.]|nr:DNA (cytosine-5-)-methyltransferase [Prosthecobacter sp.]